MIHKEIDIDTDDFLIKTDIKIPNDTNSRLGIVLVHGGIINRKSLLRTKYCLGEYFCKELEAYVIAPDFMGETTHKKELSFDNYCEILNLTTEYFVERYNLQQIMGFGHSMGCYVLANALSTNKYFNCIVNFGGPIKELETRGKRNVFQYVIDYLSTYNYKIDLRNLTNYIFDKETNRYLQNVMLKEKEYGYEHYDFIFEPSIFREMTQIILNYFDTLIKWDNPALLLFGSKDTLTKRTYNYFTNNYINKNIIFKHVNGASHVTPCMESKLSLSKLNDALSFFKENKKTTLKQKQKITTS